MSAQRRWKLLNARATIRATRTQSPPSEFAPCDAGRLPRGRPASLVCEVSRSDPDRELVSIPCPRHSPARRKTAGCPLCGRCCGTTRRSTHQSGARPGWPATSTVRPSETSCALGASCAMWSLSRGRRGQPPIADIGRVGWRNETSLMPWPGRLVSIAARHRSAISSSSAPLRREARRSDSSRANRQLRT